MDKRKTLEEFIINARIKHGNKYDYTKSVYTASTKNIIITCPVHGDFTQTPSLHLRHGCKYCAWENNGNNRANGRNY